MARIDATHVLRFYGVVYADPVTHNMLNLPATGPGGVPRSTIGIGVRSPYFEHRAPPLKLKEGAYGTHANSLHGY